MQQRSSISLLHTCQTPKRIYVGPVKLQATPELLGRTKTHSFQASDNSASKKSYKMPQSDNNGSEQLSVSSTGSSTEAQHRAGRGTLKRPTLSSVQSTVHSRALGIACNSAHRAALSDRRRRLLPNGKLVHVAPSDRREQKFGIRNEIQCL